MEASRWLVTLRVEELGDPGADLRSVRRALADEINLVGEIPSSLGRLKKLTDLDLAIHSLSEKEAEFVQLLFPCPFSAARFLFFSGIGAPSFSLLNKTSGKMAEIQLGTHTVKSHGVKVARTHMHDWLILLLLIVIEIVLNVIEPFHRFVGKDMLTDLSFPLKSNTVPVWAVPIVAVLLPLVIISVYYFIRRDVYDLHHAVLGSFAGLGFIALYLSGKIRVFDQRGHVAKLCIIFAPLLLAALIGISRVDDYWHHWQDVFAGGLLGLVVSSFCYLQFFPPPHSIDGWGPHAYFQMLAESASRDQPSTNSSTALIVRGAELESVYVEPQHGNRQ
ncbi:Lipid phosphate phosphatase 1 [Linum grandiflorum]